MSLRMSLALLLAAATPAQFAAAAPPQIPAEIVAMLDEHRGSWRADGWINEGGKRTPVKATWECKAALNSIGNVCTWNHEWVDRPHDSALEIMGYDPRLNVLKVVRLNDTGIMTPGADVVVRGNTMNVVWESLEDGKTRVIRNEIVVVKSGEWQQRVTVDLDGKRLQEIILTQRRIR
jgi:hypothetical protein